MPLYASLESSSGPPMVFCYCCLDTTLMAFRYYLSGLQLRYYLKGPLVLPYWLSGTTLKDRRYYLKVNFNSLDVKYVLVVFGCLVGYPSDDINKFLWMVCIGGGVFPHIKEPDYLVICWLLVIWILSMSPLGSYCWCIVGTLVSSFRHVFTTHHWMVRIYKLKPPKNRIRVKTKKSKSKASSTTSSKKKRRIPGNERHFQKMLSPISYL
ncbi:unnamed protein product, partial [Vitis vinifera]